MLTPHGTWTKKALDESIKAHQVNCSSLNINTYSPSRRGHQSDYANNCPLNLNSIRIHDIREPMTCNMQLPAQHRSMGVPTSSRELTMRQKPQGNWQFMNISKPTQTRDANFRRIVRENAAHDHVRNQRSNTIESFRKIGTLPKVEKRSLSTRRTTKPTKDEGVVSEESSCDDDSISVGSRRSWGDITFEPQTQHTAIRSDTPELPSWDPKAHIAISKRPSPECYEGWESNFNNDNRCFKEPSIENDPEKYCGASIASPFGATPGDPSPQSQVLLHHCE